MAALANSSIEALNPSDSALEPRRRREIREMKRLDRRFCIAPMMDWTDRHCRVFHRMLTGEDPDRAPRLETGAGYNRAAVGLWRRLGAGDLSARALAVEARALEAGL